MLRRPFYLRLHDKLQTAPAPAVARAFKLLAVVGGAFAVLYFLLSLGADFISMPFSMQSTGSLVVSALFTTAGQLAHTLSLILTAVLVYGLGVTIELLAELRDLQQRRVARDGPDAPTSD